ncbi:MAG: hypothetical protein JSV44_07365 [Candidatus Zixiibacteriota bacterium]|nr:MAG: hypothetical protein JSV44_07365 [candidate division Zixibacteria bacterium]
MRKSKNGTRILGCVFIILLGLVLVSSTVTVSTVMADDNTGIPVPPFQSVGDSTGSDENTDSAGPDQSPDWDMVDMLIETMQTLY